MEHSFLYIAILSQGILTIYWLLIYSSLKYYKTQASVSKQFPVSIIICVRNQLNQIQSNLEFFQTQVYPEFEIILVDDDSTDGLEEWVNDQKFDINKFSYLKIEKTKDGKKQALTSGILHARYDYLALSDADCKPISNRWLQSMMEARQENHKIVLAYAPYQTSPGLLNKFIRFETAFNALQYLSFAQRNIPYMGVGRNLIYHKSLFHLDALHLNLSFGDDDLFINAVAKPDNTSICLNPDSFVMSQPKYSYAHYFKQRWRHYAASHHYKTSSKIILAVYFGSMYCFYLSLFVLLVQKDFFSFSILLCLHGFILWPVFCTKMNLLKEKGLCLIFPLLLGFYCLHLMLLFPFGWV